MFIRQYFDEQLTDKWLPTQYIFYDQPFSFTAREQTIRIWARNESSSNFAEVTISTSAVGSPYITSDDLRAWVKFGETDDDITHSSLSLSRLNSQQVKNYYIKVTIPNSVLDDANFNSIVPVTAIKFHVAAVAADTTTTIVYKGRDAFEHSDGNLYRAEIDDEGWIVLSDSPLSGTWARTINFSDIVPYRITSLEVVAETPDGTSIESMILRADTEIDVITAYPAITIPQPSTLSDEEQSLAYARVVVTLNDSDPAQGYTPRVCEVKFTAVGDFTNTFTYRSLLRFDKLDELPNGVIALNKNSQVLSILNNELVSFSFGFDRYGGNADFSLMLRQNWDYELPFTYDDSIVYVQDNKVQYRGIVDKIHTKLLDNKESINVSGSGLAKQMKTIIVNQRFSNMGITAMIRHLLDKYLSHSRSPAIYYNNILDLEQISTTVDNLNFRNETLFDCINKIGNIAGANPTNEGGDGNDIIWGVDERCRFYFKRKSTKLEYRFHVGKDISLDDNRIAPRFNKVTLVGYTAGDEMENRILDGDCEKTMGSGDEEVFNTYWLVSDHITVKAVTDVNDVYHGSQAYQFPISDEDATSHSTTFRALPFDLERHTNFMLSFWAKASSSRTVTLVVGIRTALEEIPRSLPSDLFETIDITQEYLLGSDFTKYIVGPYEVPGITFRSHFGSEAEMEYMPTTVYFAAKETDPDEEITIDAIFLHKGKLPIPPNNFIREDGHLYQRQVFSSDGRFEVAVSDWTEISKFGRIKESIREVDTINEFKEAYNYARSILGGNSSETRRAVVTVRNSEELYKPYNERDEIQWGYAQVFGSTNTDTHYEYSVISVKHTLKNNRFDSKIEVGAKRPTVDEMIRVLTARERFRGEGADTTN